MSNWQSTLDSKLIAKLSVQVIRYSWQYVHHVGDVVDQTLRWVGDHGADCHSNNKPQDFQSLVGSHATEAAFEMQLNC